MLKINHKFEVDNWIQLARVLRIPLFPFELSISLKQPFKLETAKLAKLLNPGWYSWKASSTWFYHIGAAEPVAGILLENMPKAWSLFTWLHETAAVS